MKWRKNSGGTKTGRRVARAGMNGGKTGNRNGKSGRNMRGREGEKANATKKKEECKKEEEKEESVLQGTPARWKNRNGPTKERGRRKWMEGKAREAARMKRM